MATLTETPKAHKVSKSIRSLRISDPINGARTMVVTQDGERVSYNLREIACDFGRGFTLTKCAEGTGSDKDASSYDVRLDEATGDSCTCKGFVYRRHGKPCKHLAAVMALFQLGTL
jgi:hypothetical protein